MKTEAELREQVFRKMGWRKKPFTLDSGKVIENLYWDITATEFDTEKMYPPLLLPPIETSWEVCAKYLVPFMRERGYSWTATVYQFSDRLHSDFHFEWWHETKTTVYESDIKDDNIAEAACKAFMEVELERDK